MQVPHPPLEPEIAELSVRRVAGAPDIPATPPPAQGR